MDRKIIVTTDGANDLTDDLIEKYNINSTIFGININEQSYYSDIEITKEDIYNKYLKSGVIAKTSAISIGEYIEFFNTFIEKGYDVIHISISSHVSCSYQNCIAAQVEVGNKLHVIDSGSISTGIGMLAIEACNLIDEGLEAIEIADSVSELQKKLRASFIVEDLKFLSAGGRCSKVTALGANLLSIKPSIIINNGKLETGKKYRGSWEKVVLDFVNDTLNQYDIKDNRIFVIHSGVDQNIIDKVVEEIKSKTNIKEIYVCVTKATIFCHCGPNAIGFSFFEK